MNPFRLIKDFVREVKVSECEHRTWMMYHPPIDSWM